MIKINGIFVILAAVALLSISCVKPVKNEENGQSEILEIKEKMFIGQVNDVYLNPKDYLGRKIKLEGIYRVEDYPETQETFHMIIRYGPGGCCGIDGIVGFEVAWSSRQQEYPENGSWVEVIGELKYQEEGLSKYLYLDLISFNVLDLRGAEFVNQ